MNSGSVVPSATIMSPIIIEGMPMFIAMAWELCTIKYALTSISVMLIRNLARFLSRWSLFWNGLWKYCLSFSSRIMNPIPAARSIIPSVLDSIPFIPKIIGNSVRMAKYRSFFTIEL